MYFIIAFFLTTIINVFFNCIIINRLKREIKHLKSISKYDPWIIKYFYNYVEKSIQTLTDHINGINPETKKPYLILKHLEKDTYICTELNKINIENVENKFDL